MASIINRPHGHRWIQFVDANSKRQTIRLGKLSKRAAESVCVRVEELLAAKMTGTAPDRDMAGWLAGIDAPLQNKLASVGLCEARESAVLQSFIRRYVEDRTDVKPATKEVWRQGEMGLVEFFGGTKALGTITPGDADRYKLHLIGRKLAPMTVRKRLQFATMIFRAAVRRRLIAENPFVDVSIKATMPNRERYITAVETAKLLDACPNHHWRMIVALARYGALRCPSEVLSLRWQDIDWATGRIVVTSPKTEHHAGKANRTIPLFPELRPILAEAFDLAPDGAVYVVDERMRTSAQGSAGWRSCNLRTTFAKIVRRAGLTVWPRLFHNLRSSRQTELAEHFPSHVVCDWLGNSEAIARKHYYQTTDDHFKRAVEAATDPKQNPKQSVAVLACKDSQPEDSTPVLSSKNDILRHPAQYNTDGEGFEPVSLTPCPVNSLHQSQNQGEAESEAVLDNLPPFDPGLAIVVDAWPTLPEAVKAAILAMIPAPAGRELDVAGRCETETAGTNGLPIPC